MSVLSAEVGYYLPDDVGLIVLGYVGKWVRPLEQFVEHLLIGDKVYTEVHNILNMLEPSVSSCQCKLPGPEFNTGFRARKMLDTLIYCRLPDTLIWICKHLRYRGRRKNETVDFRCYTKMPEDLPKRITRIRETLLLMNDPYLVDPPYLPQHWADELTLWFYHDCPPLEPVGSWGSHYYET